MGTYVTNCFSFSHGSNFSDCFHCPGCPEASNLTASDQIRSLTYKIQKHKEMINDIGNNHRPLRFAITICIWFINVLMFSLLILQDTYE